jgi:hypothetical protein
LRPDRGPAAEPDQPILLAIDDTLFHRASRRLPLAAFHHDPTAPAGRRIGWGHCWVVVGILVKLPFVPHRQVYLPVLARLWRPRDPTTGHIKLVLAHQMIRLVAARHHTGRSMWSPMPPTPATAAWACPSGSA